VGRTPRIARYAGWQSRDARHEQAVTLYESLLEAEPTLEDVVRARFRCYAAMAPHETVGAIVER
jgi:hypothetical protein